jgi:hypothetical protein
VRTTRWPISRSAWWERISRRRDANSSEFSDEVVPKWASSG